MLQFVVIEEQEAMSEMTWLLERVDILPPTYLRDFNSGDVWQTTDPLEAKRFSSKAEAEDVLAYLSSRDLPTAIWEPREHEFVEQTSFNIDPEWLKRMAEKEDGSFISVGGWVTDIEEAKNARLREPNTETRRLEEIKRVAQDPQTPAQYREMLQDLIEMLRLTAELAESRRQRLGGLVTDIEREMRGDVER